MTNNTTAPALTDEQRIRASMTREQIQLERKLTCEAIVGAIAFGQQGTNPPPSEDHWLAPFWKIGQQLALLTSPRAAMAADRRKAFETAMAGIPVEDSNATSFIRDGDDSYVQRHVESAWLGFLLACDLLDAAPAAPVAEISPNECAPDVYKHGKYVGYFDIPKHIANALCAALTTATGIRIDWHYVGGRVAMKALLPENDAAQAVAADGSAALTDMFQGDDAALIRSIEALIAMNDNGALVPHGIGGHARSLLSAAAVRLSSARAAVSPATRMLNVCDANALRTAIDAAEIAKFIDAERAVELRDIVMRAAVSPATAEPASAQLRCRKCGDQYDVAFSYAKASTATCCGQTPCAHPGVGPCDKPAAATADERAAMSGECFIVIGHGESDIPEAKIIARREDLLDAVLGMIYTHASEAPDDVRAEYAESLSDSDEWAADQWLVDFEIGGIIIWRVGLHPVTLRASQAAAPAEAREPHSDDIAVDAFAAAMKAKMAASRAKGRGGWETCTPSDLSRMLREHVEKGDPRDVVNFCMMLHHHGAPIGGAADAGEAVALTAAARDVLAERARQVSAEGWTPEHDDQYQHGSIAQAAGCYALHASGVYKGMYPSVWPWMPKWWKPTTPRRDLVKAGALILAEIERLDRAEAREQGAQGGKGGEA